MSGRAIYVRVWNIEPEASRTAKEVARDKVEEEPVGVAIKDCIDCALLGRKRRQSRYFCALCPTKPVLCIEPCFQEWHSQLFRDEEATVNTNSSDSDSD